jgi:hypothetical protein
MIMPLSDIDKPLAKKMDYTASVTAAADSWSTAAG